MSDETSTPSVACAGRGGDRRRRSVRADECRLDGARPVGHLSDTGQGDVRLGDPARTVREHDRRDPDRGVPRGGLLQRRVGRGGVVTPAGNADLGQDLARLEPGREGTFEEPVDATSSARRRPTGSRARPRGRAGRPAGPTPDRHGRSSPRSCPRLRTWTSPMWGSASRRRPYSAAGDSSNSAYVVRAPIANRAVVAARERHAGPAAGRCRPASRPSPGGA